MSFYALYVPECPWLLQDGSIFLKSLLGAKGLSACELLRLQDIELASQLKMDIYNLLRRNVSLSYPI